MAKQLLFVPTHDELDYIQDNIESWSDWCHKNLYKDRRNNKHLLVENISTRLLLIVAGLVVSSISFMTPYLIIIVPSFLLGTVMILVGTFGIWRIYINERK